MHILILSTDYPDFLRALYLTTPGLADADYATQAEARQRSLFGFCDFYSRNFRANGHEARDVRVNNPWMQHAWAREHGLAVAPPAPPQAQRSRSATAKLARRLLRPLGTLVRSVRPPVRGGITDWEATILHAQIEEFRPDIILNQEPHYHSSAFLRTLRRPGLKIAGQLASELPAGETFQAYDLMFSSLPNIVDWIRRQGARAEMVRLGFEPTILDAFGAQPARDIDLSFVGSLSPHHAGRIEWLEYLARRAPLKLWGSGIHLLPKASPLHACHQGEAWGRGMYEVLRRSRITLNNHIDLAEGWANNMRLYEATGAGAALLTDSKRNLHEIFAPGREVATYTTPQDCLEQVHALLADEGRRAAMADAGHRRVIGSHSYFNRAREMADILKTL